MSVHIMGSTNEASSARRWAMLVCSLIAAMSTSCVISGVAYLIPALHTEDGLSLTTASTLAVVPTVGLMIAIIPWGALLDRHGERRILIISLSISLLGAAGAAFAALGDAGMAALAAFLFIGGIGAGAANGASGRIVVGWFPAEKRGTAMGFRQMAQPLSIGLCALTMPAIAASSGIGAALMVPLVMMIIGLAVCVFGIADPPMHESPLQPSGSEASGSETSGSDISGSESEARAEAEAARRRRAENPYRANRFLVRVHGFSMLLVIPQSMLWTFVPTWLIVGHDWAPTTAGILITVTQIVGALGRIVAGRVSDVMGSRMRPVRYIAATAAVATGAMALLDQIHSPVAVAVMVIASIASVADNGLAFTAIAEYAGPRWSGRGLAVQNTAQFLTTSATTPVFGAMISAAGYPAAFAMAAAAPLLALPVIPRDVPNAHLTPRPETRLRSQKP